MSERIKAVLQLEDGTRFDGYAIGKIGTTTGEIAFNTGMTGYQEVFTDPSYLKQILIMTTSHIGNYGVSEVETESDSIQISGLVTKKFSENYSRPAGFESLNDYLLSFDKVGISDVDTRALVRHVRSKGAQNAIISSEGLSEDELKARLNATPSMEGLELSSQVSSTEIHKVPSKDSKGYNVGLIDYGVKTNIIRCLNERGCDVTVYPWNTKAEDILAAGHDGIMLSNGPGDPSSMTEAIAEVAKIVEANRPTFGICLGHQILALSQGLTTEKMHNGHRGLNHPIKNLKTGKGEITSQNHGFVVARESISNNENVDETHVHLNDNTVAGIEIADKPIFSVQYHPEASAVPHDSRYLFDQFVVSASMQAPN